MTEDRSYDVLQHIQDEASTSKEISNAKNLPVGNFSCLNYHTTSNCYVTTQEHVSILKNDSQILMAFGRMIGAVQALPFEDHDGVKHTYYSLKDKIIVKATLKTLDEDERNPSEAALNYLVCKRKNLSR